VKLPAWTTRAKTSISSRAMG